MLLKTDLNINPNCGHNPNRSNKPRLTIPANIKAIAATKKGKVSFTVKLNNPTINPRIIKKLNVKPIGIILLKIPATIASSNPTKKV